MVTKQGEIVDKQAAFQNQLQDIYDAVPEEEAGCTKDQQDSFRSLKTEIDVAMTEVHEKVAVVVKKIEANFMSEDNPQGLLVQGKQKYLSCLQMQQKELEILLRQDNAHWEQNLKAVKNQKKEVSDEIRATMVRQQTEMEDILSKTAVL